MTETILSEKDLDEINATTAESQRTAELYASAHPELPKMIHDFVQNVLVDMPDNVLEYARKYFADLAEADLKANEK